MGTEFELKYSATEKQQEAILASFPGAWQRYSMETTYYDSPSGALAARRITLRRRKENGVSICTLKTPEKNGVRGEWDCEAETIEAAVEILCKLSGEEALLGSLKQGLVPSCGARFQRLALTISAENCIVELALDSGVLLGGGKEEPLCEVEAELKDGDRSAAETFACQIAEQFGLQEEKRSKFCRALGLARGE